MTFWRVVYGHKYTAAVVVVTVYLMALSKVV